jgi:hypothetical protein
MTKSNSRQDLSFEFFANLKRFYDENKPSIRKHYKELTKRILDYNDPSKGTAFLRKPQFEALEMYVFLKEFTNNRKVHEIFRDWHDGRNGFEQAKFAVQDTKSGQISFMKELMFSNPEEYQRAFNYLASASRQYSNYIFALTMGTGKTILMATCIFYEFILANKFRKDPKYCHNALVFAPDKTVLQSLREIKDFDVSKVLPPEYANFISSAVKFHYLSDTDATISTQAGSLFNIVISNTQKIIIKKQHKEKSSLELFYTQPSSRALQEDPEKKKTSIFDDLSDILDDTDTPQEEKDLLPNARFQRIARLPQLGIYVDEAHHAIGNELAKSQTNNKSESSLRTTINELANRLEQAGSRVVACYNYTGTPYIGSSIMPEVVYAYSLKDAIKNKYLKETDPVAYSNIKSEDFIRNVIKDFWKKEGEKRFEGMLPKLAFFASTIDELANDLLPVVEKVLDELNIPSDKILVNVGDTGLTKNDDLREFNTLDTPTSNKQFILLVNKGREGWNCRSLFGVALYREPKSTIFVLQATMRCLRSIGPNQETGHIYLSEENLNILDNELQRNFNVTLEEIKKKEELPSYTVRMVPPPVKVTVNRVRRVYSVSKKQECPEGIDFELDKIDYNKYKVIRTDRQSILVTDFAKVTDITDTTNRRQFSAYTLIAEIARYFNNGEVSCLTIKKILETSQDGMDKILSTVNRYNDILYDVIIPIIYKNLYDVTSTDSSEPEELELVRVNGTPENTVFVRKCDPKLMLSMQNTSLRDVVEKSFNLDTYCFDSKPEIEFFKKSIYDDNIEKIYFTGMLTHGESDFYINYIDPESHMVRNYYPDFLIKTMDNKWLIIEIKGDNKIDDPVVLAKAEYARKLAADSMFQYFMIKGTDAEALGFAALSEKEYNPCLQV